MMNSDRLYPPEKHDALAKELAVHTEINRRFRKESEYRNILNEGIIGGVSGLEQLRQFYAKELDPKATYETNNAVSTVYNVADEDDEDETIQSGDMEDSPMKYFDMFRQHIRTLQRFMDFFKTGKAQFNEVTKFDAENYTIYDPFYQERNGLPNAVSDRIGKNMDLDGYTYDKTKKVKRNELIVKIVDELNATIQ